MTELSGWQAPAWAKNAIFYQIFPERFCNGDPGNDPQGSVPWESIPTRETFFGGDLAGITARLDYLHSLGITALYLTPFFAAQTNHRYDTSDYLAVDPAAGTLEDFRALVAALKQRGMRPRPGRGLQPLRRRLFCLSGCTGARSRLALPRLVPDPVAAAGHPTAQLPDLRRRGISAQAQHRQPHRGRLPAAGGGTLAA
jgi:hypothetical protein